MKTFDKIIMAILLMAGLASCSNVKEPKVVSTEEFENILGEQMINATFDDGMIMRFQIKSPSEVAVSSYKKIPTSGRVTIPSKIISNGNTYQVVEIGSLAFQDCEDMISVIIPNSVTNIGNNAFIDCIGLTSASIPKEVTSAGFGIFSYCTGLTSVIIEKGVTEIGEEAFVGCTGLTSISIPNSVTSIGERAFVGCTGLTSISIPNSVTSIGERAFADCTGLTSVSISNSVTSIGERAFADCTGLTSVSIPNSVTDIGREAFSGCTGLTSVSISKGITNIMAGTFSDCKGLTSFSVPKGVTEIGSWAFSDCSGLTSISIPNSVTSIGKYAFKGCSGLSSFTIPNGVRSIGEGAFSDCSGLTSITLPSSLTEMGNYAFFRCKGLTNVIIQTQNISFDYDNVFAYCEKLQPSNEVFLSDASNDVKEPTKEYEWIVGTWACDMGPYGNVVVKFDGDGSSGTCTEAQYGSYKTGTYYVSGNTLCYKLNGESVTTTIEIESGHRLAAGGGYYYHKRDNGDEQRNEANNNGKPHVPNDATKGIFSVGYSQQVSFAKGNLQYQASSGTWRFANNQWETMGQGNVNISANSSGWIDLFGWGTGNGPLNHSENNNDYSTFCDWGSYGMGDGWRTPTLEEWDYLFTGRSDAYNKYGAAIVNGVAGIVVLPDNWVLPSGLSFKHSFDYSQNTYDNASWSKMEEAGAVFLPAAGRRTGNGIYNHGNDCDYWSSTPNGSTKAFNVDLTKGKKLIPRDDSPRKHGFAVRLIKNI